MARSEASDFIRYFRMKKHLLLENNSMPPSINNETLLKMALERLVLQPMENNGFIINWHAVSKRPATRLLLLAIAKYRRIRTKRCRILIEDKVEARALPVGNVIDDNKAIDYKEKLFFSKYKVFGYTVSFLFLFYCGNLTAQNNNLLSNKDTPSFLSTPALASGSNAVVGDPSHQETKPITASASPTNSSPSINLSSSTPTNLTLPIPDSTPVPTLTLPSSTSSSLPTSNIIPNNLSTNQPSYPSPLGANLNAFADLGLNNKNSNNIPFSTKSLTRAGEQVNSGVVAKNAPVLTIDDCVKTALEKNPSVLQAIDTIRQQSGNFISVRSAMLPHFGVTNANYAWVDPQLNNKNNLPANLVPNNQTWGISLGASQLLYNGGTAQANAKAAKFSEQMAYYQLRVTINAVIAQVVSAFYQVVLDRALVVANQQSVEVLATNVADQKSRYDAGTVPRFSVLQAEVQLANAQPGLIAARNNLRIALFQLVQLIGMNYPNLQNAEVPFQVVGELDYHPRKINSNESIYTALQRSPILKAQRQNILIMAQTVTAALGGFLPTIGAVGGYQYQSYDGTVSQGNGASQGAINYSHNLGNFVSGWFFGIQGNWNIFDGLNTYGNVKQSKANLMFQKTAYDNAVRQVILSVQQAISNMQQAQETVESQKANVMQAAEALRLAQERLNAGAGVQLDVLNAQVQLLSAQTSVLQSEYNYIAATALYDQALSLNTQYEELFDDPMNHRERARYQNLISSHHLDPALPRALRATDPLPTAFVEKAGWPAPSPTPSAKAKKKK